jgi:hypothetical protein
MMVPKEGAAMVEELLAILGVYGMSIGLVHLLQWHCHWGRRREPSHAVIITRNAGMTVEWHLRMFALMQWLKARHTKITIVDEGSSDDTIRITQRMIAQLGADWEFVRAGSPAEASRWLESGKHPCEVLILRGPLVRCTGPAV